jgi:hypothetical protein
MVSRLVASCSTFSFGTLIRDAGGAVSDSPVNVAMPELSRFYGIIIRMYCELGSHHSPHFHAYHGDDEAVYGLDPIELLAGSLPRRQARLVEAWAELHQSELVADWGRLQAGSEALPIDPLP